MTLALTDETSDSKGNTPSVYLTLDKEGVITEAGYWHRSALSGTGK